MDKEKLATAIVNKLHQAGFEAYFAGGCVRDKLLGKQPSDYDIATSAKPEQVQNLFEKTIPVGAQFGVIIVLEEGISFEVATFRTEGGYKDGRRPTIVEFATVEEDAKRRDFTVNGLYWDLKNKKVLDFVGGEKDLKAKVIQTIGNAEERFLEDHLRLIRAVRFSIQLDFAIAPETWKTVLKHHSLLKTVSMERIRDEFSKIMTSADPEKGIRMLDESKLLPVFLPEVETLKGVEQPSEYHPEGDVYIHTLLLLKGLNKAPLELALGCLLHDIAKPATFVRATDRIRFHGHDKLGAEMSRSILKRLCFSNDQIDLICELVLEHLKFKDAFQMKKSTLKRFLSLPRFDLHLELHRLDCLASHAKLEAYDFTKAAYETFLKEPPPPRKLVTGQDLLEMGHKAGPQFSKILHEVEDAILEGELSTREEALEWVKKRHPAK